MHPLVRLGFSLGIASLALLCPGTAATAQTLPDSVAWRDTGPKTPHGLAVVKTTDGKTVRSYFPVDCIGFEEKILYFSRNPEVRPFPRIQYVDVKKISSATIRGHQLENMGAAGYPEVLAMRLVEGPVELFAVSGSVGDKVPLIFSVVNPALAGATILAQLGGSAMERNRWFLRRNGQLVALTHGNFRKLMTDYTADCLAISTQIKQGSEGFHYKDTPQIINLYNQFLLNNSAAPSSH
ncbi:hypothetical protein ACFPAF_10105 [Hymenobacter endophyticus]|uniref:Uncharacterized protein n=1 Tax=Hymenobacter endophyticus TaxID=3076335 RepID=A0ABU3TH98_9BACT|nr:hypothetical protein [Hymenobacter endophyticus]MDU0370746.1 hypothetical protein [Hymenobacter endophyticus]